MAHVRSTGLLTIAILVLALAGASGSGASREPANAEFRDSVADRVRSDGRDANGDGLVDPYMDGFECVISYVQSNFYFLRTVSHDCPSEPVRGITLEFSDAVDPPESCLVHDPNSGQTLDACGTQVVADVRLIAEKLFSRTALKSGTPVVLPFSLAPDFQNTAFSLEYEQALPVSLNAVADPNVRVLTAPAGATAELYQNLKQGRRTLKVRVGRYRMPFELTVTKLW